MNFEYTLQEIDTIAQKIIKATNKKMFLFYGGMGVGKTTLIKAFAKQLGVIDSVSSPTFSLVNEYHDQDNNSIFHFDFYRIEEESEALDMGIEEYFDTDTYCLIEWPEKIKNLLPLSAVTVTITEKINGSRKIILENI